jgi:hypothetical protein
LKTWTESDAYGKQAFSLTERFVKNFSQFAGSVPDEVIAAGPQPGKDFAGAAI